MDTSELILESRFTTIEKNKEESAVLSLFRTCIRVNKTNDPNKENIIPLSSVVGTNIINDELQIFIVKTKKSKKEWKFSHLSTGSSKIKKTIWIFKSKDEEEIKKWNHLLIYDIINGLKYLENIDLSLSLPELPLPKKYLIIINPKSGKGFAEKHYKEYIKPVLDASPNEYTTVVTKFPKHATEICQNTNLKDYNGIVCLGGDGIVFESIQGLMKNKTKGFELPSIGVVSSGSGNGLATDLGCGHPLAAARIIARGRTRKIDLFSCWQNDQVYYSFLSLSFGLVADLDLGTDFMRALGSGRFIIGGVGFILRKRFYDMELKFITAPAQSFDDDLKQENSASSVSTSNTSIIEDNSKQEKIGEPADSIIPNLLLHYFEKEFEDICPNLFKQYKEKTQSQEYFGDYSIFDSNVKNTWKSLIPKENVKSSKKKHFFFLLGNGPHISNDTCISPFASLDDGRLHLTRIETSLPRSRLFGLMTKLEDGSFISRDKNDNPGIDYEQCLAIYFRPISKGSFVDLDGEKLDYKPLLIEIHPRALPVYVDEDLDFKAHIDK